MAKISENTKPVSELHEAEKSHGRIDKRTYKSYTIKNEFFDERWSEANFQTFVQVQRTSLQCKTNAESKEISYYLSNAKIKDKKDVELSKAIRGHWNVETNNYIRNITFKEDGLRTKESTITRVMVSCRTLIISLLMQVKAQGYKSYIGRIC